MNDELIGMREVLKITKLARWSLIRRINDQEFPPPVGKKGKKLLWSRYEVGEWLAILERYNAQVPKPPNDIELLVRNWRQLYTLCSTETEIPN